MQNPVPQSHNFLSHQHPSLELHGKGEGRGHSSLGDVKISKTLKSCENRPIKEQREKAFMPLTCQVWTGNCFSIGDNKLNSCEDVEIFYSKHWYDQFPKPYFLQAGLYIVQSKS